MRRPRPATTALAALSVTLAAGAAVVITVPPARAASPCQVAYAANEWPGGFTATVRLSVAEAHDAWTVTWTYAAGQQVTSAWSTQAIQAGAVVTARNAPWNGRVAAGGTVEFGLQGSWTGTNPAPTDFALDGVPCNDPGPTPGPTTPAPQPPPPPAPQPPPPPPPAPQPPPPPPPAPPQPPPPAGCSGALICDGFEDQTGSTPSGAWRLAFPDCQGTGNASVDTSVARTGTRSIRVNGGVGYCNHVFVQATRPLGTSAYVRYYVRHTTALPASHVTFLAMNDSADGDRDLRMGGQNGALQWNRESDDATLPEQSPSGVALSRPLPTASWQCVEFLVDGARGTLRTWLNGTEVPGLVADGVPTQDIDRQWSGRANWRPSLTDLKLGWESYGEGADTLWYDDVAVGSTRLGC